MKTHLLLFCGFALFATAVFGQNTPPTRCAANPNCRVFDFWIGAWEVKTTDGKIAGQSIIELSLDSCLIIENWLGASGYSGKSFNFFNSNSGKWNQTWVDNAGGNIEFVDGDFSDGAMRFRSSRPLQDGRVRRLTFFAKGRDEVRQLGEWSADQGKTWQAEYDLRYFRKKV